MNTDYVQQLTDMTTAAQETSRQWLEINTGAFNKLALQQMTMVETGIERGFGAARQAMQAKGYDELVSVQANMAQELATMTVEQTRKMMQVLGESRDALTELIEKSVAQAASELEKTEVMKAA